MKQVFSRFSHSFALMLALSLTVGGDGLAHADLMSKINPLHWMPDKTQQDAKADQKALQRANEANAQAEQALKAAQEALLRAEQAKKQAEALQLEAQSAKTSKLVVHDPEDSAKDKSEAPIEQISESEAVSPNNNEKSGWAPLKLFKKNTTQAPDNAPQKSAMKEQPLNKASQDAPVALLSTSEANSSNEDPSKNSASAPWNPLTWFSKPASEGSTANATATDTLPTKPQTTNAASGEVNLKTKAAIMETEKGTITFELYPDEAPATVNNFAKLIDEGFYNRFNMKFHRVVPGFVVQTGDPTGTGAGGSKERIPLEAKNKLSHNAKGIVAMARGADPNSATSQFYITLAPQTTLDGKYAVFGKVIAGLDVLEKIEKGDMLYGIRLIDIDNVVRDPAPEKKHFFSSLR